MEDTTWMRLEWGEHGLTDNPFHHVFVAASRIAICLVLACGTRRQRVRVQSLEVAIWCGLWEFEWRRVRGVVYSGELALAEPFNVCGEERADMRGRIALVIRDKSQTNCSFAMKVFNVESVNG